VDNNLLTGSLDLENLPKRMTALNLMDNEFSGTISLKKLPRTMKEFWVSNNRLSGTIDLLKLPSTLEIMWLHGNTFSGSTDFATCSKLPDALHTLRVSYTQLSGEIPKRPHLTVEIVASKVISDGNREIVFDEQQSSYLEEGEWYIESFIHYR